MLPKHFRWTLLMISLFCYKLSLIIHTGCVVDAQTIHGRTPLMLAARSDEPDIVQALIQVGADVNKGI